MSQQFFAQTKISIDSVCNYIGRTISVCEIVKSTFKIGEHEYYLLNFGDLYLNQKLTLIIKKKHLKNFSYFPVKFLPGKKVCVTGCVNLYKGKTQIKVKQQSQIIIE